jgi:hypothetical protein
MMWVVVVAVVVLALVTVALARRNRSPQSSVDSFRRQIDALGPAARRTVVDQVQTAAARDPEPDRGTADGDADESRDDDSEQGGSRGT